jgi:hypothetical protein
MSALLAISQLPPNSIEPASYSSSVTCRLCDPRSGELLPGQELGQASVGRIISSLFLYVSPTRITGVFNLVFPFAEPNDAFLDYLSAIRPFLPVRLARSGFRLRQPTKRPGGFRDRRISPGLFDGI